MNIKISISTSRKINNSKKTFILYRLNDEGNRIIDFILTDNLSRFRNQYNNKFKLVTDIKKAIKNLTIQL